jgi:hypothetical protein
VLVTVIVVILFKTTFHTKSDHSIMSDAVELLLPLNFQIIGQDDIFPLLKLIMFLLFLWQMVEKLSHHRSGITVEFCGILEHLLVGIEFRAMVEFGVQNFMHSPDSYMPFLFNS